MAYQQIEKPSRSSFGDTCIEADATPEEALAMINKIMRARWQDHQLVNAGLTRAEMSQIDDNSLLFQELLCTDL